jgi:dTDP-glucose 4,6-dehydratase
MKIILTGGAGFIGSSVIRSLLQKPDIEVINVDCLTYAGNLDSLDSISSSNRYTHEEIDICDKSSITHLVAKHKPDAVMHLAAESHVDRSIEEPNIFIDTNIIGTLNLLEAARSFLQDNPKKFIFHHISTDEVYGDLGKNSTSLFKETSNYNPSSPYAASKASSDHLVRSWGRTFGIPFVISNCSNNYGPFQFPEKLIPHMIISCMQGRPLNIYGDGSQIRDWLYVEDHAQALIKIVLNASSGETYNIGGHNEKTNLEVVTMICEFLDELMPSKSSKHRTYKNLITFVQDRPGHDERYAIDASKIQKNLNWTPRETFETGLKKTVMWYLDNPLWIERIFSGAYSLVRQGAIHKHE